MRSYNLLATLEVTGILLPMVRIIPAKETDIGAIRKVQRETWLATYPNTTFGITRDDILAQFAADDSYAGRLAWLQARADEFRDHQSMAWVAELDGQIVGYAAAQKEGTQNRLNALYVLPAFQRQGIGKKLFFAVCEWLGQDKDICLNVALYNDVAIRFYAAMGCTKTGKSVTDEAARLPTGKTIPEIEMVLPPTLRPVL